MNNSQSNNQLAPSGSKLMPDGTLKSSSSGPRKSGIQISVQKSPVLKHLSGGLLSMYQALQERPLLSQREPDIVLIKEDQEAFVPQLKPVSASLEPMSYSQPLRQVVGPQPLPPPPVKILVKPRGPEDDLASLFNDEGIFEGKFESIHMMAKRLRNELFPKDVARRMLKAAFQDELRQDKKRLTNLIMTYTRMFWKKPPTQPEVAALHREEGRIMASQMEADNPERYIPPNQHDSSRPVLKRSFSFSDIQQNNSNESQAPKSKVTAPKYNDSIISPQDGGDIFQMIEREQELQNQKPPNKSKSLLVQHKVENTSSLSTSASFQSSLPPQFLFSDPEKQKPLPSINEEKSIGLSELLESSEPANEVAASSNREGLAQQNRAILLEEAKQSDKLINSDSLCEVLPKQAPNIPKPLQLLQQLQKLQALKEAARRELNWTSNKQDLQSSSHSQQIYQHPPPLIHSQQYQAAEIEYQQHIPYDFHMTHSQHAVPPKESPFILSLVQPRAPS
ncbi:hypothetical protein FGO68_gene6641 [Halteria grandinella]|uniref:Uncharacterized protein n=1 Tax=Halteria grandinella TaxID=5974 RepID=A0A8J8T4K1_HALGN|nr:hypothetical protein FGO68_gene6641 [Halteria grandinella]